MRRWEGNGKRLLLARVGSGGLSKVIKERSCRRRYFSHRRNNSAKALVSALNQMF